MPAIIDKEGPAAWPIEEALLLRDFSDAAHGKTVRAV
jgi:hypothetical protein